MTGLDFVFNDVFGGQLKKALDQLYDFVACFPVQLARGLYNRGGLLGPILP